MRNVVGGLATYYGSQNFLQTMQRLLDEGVTSGLVSNMAEQVIPLAGLVRWVNTSFIDPFYRKSSRELSAASILQNIKKDLPYFSKQVEGYPQMKFEPTEPDALSRRPLPNLNAFLPYDISPEDPRFLGDLEARHQRLERNAEKRSRRAEP